MRLSQIKDAIDRFPKGVDPEVEIEFKHLNGYEGDKFRWVTDCQGKGIGFDLRVEINENGVTEGKMIIKASDVPDDWTPAKQYKIDNGKD